MYPIPVTKGTGPRCFSLFVPIWFSDIHALKGFDVGVVDILGKTVATRVEDRLLILQVREFDSVATAESCYENVYVGVFRAVVGRRASAYVSPLVEIERGHGPIPDGFDRKVYEPWPPRTPETDGIIWRVGSYVLPEHERILLMPTGAARIIREVSPRLLTDWFQAQKGPMTWPLPDKLRLAMSIVAEANAQRSTKLEFLSLVTALEVLIEEKPLTRSQEGLVSRWKAEIDAAIDRAKESGQPDEVDGLTELRKRLGYINNSIQEGLRAILRTTARAEILDPGLNVGFTAMENLPGAVSEIYKVRSELVHGGMVSDRGSRTGQERLREAASVARYLVYCVLADRL